MPDNEPRQDDAGQQDTSGDMPADVEPEIELRHHRDVELKKSIQAFSESRKPPKEPPVQEQEPEVEDQKDEKDGG